jgi:prepilin-type N-terminal cleavage/methylation domain-containing protein
MHLNEKTESSRRRRCVPVQWQDCAWCPRIVTQLPFASCPSPTAKNIQRMPALRINRSRFYFKPMKTIPLSSRRSRAFTIVELLVVISIIALLAALLLPVLASAKKHALIAQARLQMSDIVTAIQKYDSDYSRFPVSPGVQSVSGGTNFTYGDALLVNALGPGNYATNNSEVIAILMDIQTYTNGVHTVNFGHVKNPQQTIFLNAKMGDASNTNGVVGPDLVYRDPWGNPYVISLDLDEDNEVSDAFYGSPLVSSSTQVANGSGLVGLNYHVENNVGSYAFHGNVMVWSAGPDGKVDPTATATSGANKDNVLSWQ